MIDENQKRLLWIGPERTAKTLLRFFRFLGKDRTARLQFICSDMWQGYIKVIRKKAGHAVHILDRFHVMQQENKDGLQFCLEGGDLRASSKSFIDSDLPSAVVAV